MSKKSGFNAEREAADRAWVARKRALLEAAKHGKSVDGSPPPPLVGGQVSLARELGGAAMLYLFKEICRAHGLRPDVPREFDEARKIFSDPDAEYRRRVVAMAESMNVDPDGKWKELVRGNLFRTQRDIVELLHYASQLKDGRPPRLPERFQEPTRATFSGNEPDAPATPTVAAPWTREGEFQQRLRQLAQDEGYDIRDHGQRVQAINLLVKRFPHLAPHYGFDLGPSSPRNPSLGYGSQPPAQSVADALSAGPRRLR